MASENFCATSAMALVPGGAYAADHRMQQTLLESQRFAKCQPLEHSLPKLAG